MSPKAATPKVRSLQLQTLDFSSIPKALRCVSAFRLGKVYSTQVLRVACMSNIQVERETEREALHCLSLVSSQSRLCSLKGA